PLQEDDEADGFELKPGQTLTEAERHALRNLRGHARYNPRWIDFLWGNVHLAEGMHKKAVEAFQRAEQVEPNRPGLHLQLGEAWLRMRQLEEAEACYGKATEIDPNEPRGWLGLARCGMRRRQWESAESMARTSIGLLYSNPFAHFVLGAARYRLGRVDEAIASLETALSLNPNFPQAHRRLGLIYRRDVKDRERARRHVALAADMRRENRKRREEKSRRPYRPDESWVREPLLPPSKEPEDTSRGFDPAVAGRIITVVSGLPRSGTSMVMQMLEAGGVEILTDGVREADEDNPRGYYEYEAAKRLQTDRLWMSDAVDKGIKIIVQLLPYLPRIFRYRVLLIHRDLDEVVESQTAMLERQGEDGAQLSPAALKQVFAQQLERIQSGLRRAGYIELLELDYMSVIEDPATSAERMREFLGEDLDVSAMAGVVQSSLYRRRKA
ncbi:MAG: tetratricopeptide repeat protein, partial [Verrucomicrobiota bacterium]